MKRRYAESALGSSFPSGDVGLGQGFRAGWLSQLGSLLGVLCYKGAVPYWGPNKGTLFWRTTQLGFRASLGLQGSENSNLVGSSGMASGFPKESK